MLSDADLAKTLLLSCTLKIHFDSSNEFRKFDYDSNICHKFAVVVFAVKSRCEKNFESQIWTGEIKLSSVSSLPYCRQAIFRQLQAF